MKSTKTAAAADSSRQLLRHTLATVAYRGGKTLRGAPESFAQFKISEKSRTPAQILAHIGDLYDWAFPIVDASVPLERALAQAGAYLRAAAARAARHLRQGALAAHASQAAPHLAPFSTST